MKKIILLVTSIIACATCFAQQPGSYEQYIREIEKEMGTWIADNTQYKSDQEPYDAYGLEWKKGSVGTTLIGRLFGLKDGKEVGTFWEFIRYWDPVKKETIVMQFGADGTMGTGALTHTGENSIELLQVFSQPGGVSYRVGHRTTVGKEDERTGTSYSINEKNEWQQNRTYTWKRKKE